MARALFAALTLLLVATPAAAQRRQAVPVPTALGEPQWPLPERLAAEVRVQDEHESSARAGAGLMILSSVARDVYTDPITSRQYATAAQEVARRDRSRRDPTCFAHYASSPAFYREITDRHAPAVWSIPRLEQRFRPRQVQSVWAAAAMLPAGTRHEWRNEEEAARLCGSGAGMAARAAGPRGPGGMPPVGANAPDLPPGQALSQGPPAGPPAGASPGKGKHRPVAGRPATEQPPLQPLPQGPAGPPLPQMPPAEETAGLPTGERVNPVTVPTGQPQPVAPNPDSPTIGSPPVSGGLPQPPPPAAGPPTRTRYFAGLDLGSRGVKAFIYSFVRGDDGADSSIVFHEERGTKLVTSAKEGRFSPQGIEDAAAAAQALVGRMRTFAARQAIEPTFVLLGSSGVAAFSNRADLKAAVDKGTGLELEFLDGRTEARDALLAVVPSLRRDESLMVDIGGANTKLACMTGGDSSDVVLPYGAVTLRQQVPPGPDYAAGLQAAVAKVADALKAERMNTPCIASRKRTYLTGGAAFAVATFTHPEAALWGFVPLTPKDVEAFKRALREGTWNTRPPRFTFEPSVPNALQEATRQANQEDRVKAQDIYSREDYLAGVSILAAILDNGNPAALIYFVRNANYLFGFAAERYGLSAEAPVGR